MSMSMSQIDEKMLFSSLSSSGGICTPLPPGEQKVRRRRKKPREEGSTGVEAKKRRLSEEQVKFLETSFRKERKLESGRKAHLASELGIDPKQVAVWFQNRRARSKSKQLEEEYMKVKSAHEMAVVEKCHLEAEVLKLKEQLAEAQKEIRKLSDSSPSTSFSMDNNQQQQPLFGGIGTGGEDQDNIVYINEYNYVNLLDWANSYGM